MLPTRSPYLGCVIMLDYRYKKDVGVLSSAPILDLRAFALPFPKDKQRKPAHVKCICYATRADFHTYI